MCLSILLYLTTFYLLIGCNQKSDNNTISPIDTSATMIKEINEKRLKENMIPKATNM